MTRAAPSHGGARWPWLVLLLLLALIGAALHWLPELARSALVRFAARHDLQLSMARVEPRLDAMGLDLVGVALGRDGEAVTAQRVALRVDALTLLFGDTALTSLRLDGARVVVRRVAPDGPWLAGGLAPGQWLAGALLVPIDLLVIRNARVHGDTGGLGEVALGRLQVRGLKGRRRTGALQVDLEAALADARITANGRVWPFLEQPELDMQVGFSDLDLSPLVAVFDDLVLTGGTLDGELELDLHLARGGEISGQANGRLAAAGLTGRRNGLMLRDATLSSRASTHIRLAPGQGLRALSWRGQLEVPGLALVSTAGEAGASRVTLENAAWEGRAEWQEDTETASGGLALDGDANASRLTLNLAGGGRAGFERLAVWGVERRPGETLRLGRAQAGRANLDLPGQSWSAADLDTGVVALGPDGGLRVDALQAGPVRLAGNEPGAGPGSLEQVSVTALTRVEARWQAENLALKGLRLSTSGKRPAELKFASLTALDPSFAPATGLHAGQVRVEGLHLLPVRDRAGRWRLPAPVWPGTGGPTSPPVALDRLLLEEGRLTFTDYRVEPRFRLDLMALSGQLTAWHSGGEGPGGRFRLQGRTAGGEALNLQGRLANRLSVRGRAAGLPLKDLAGYTRPLLGIDPTAGSGLLELELEGPPRALEGDLRLLLTDLELVPALAGRDANGLSAGQAGRLQRLLGDGRGAVALQAPLAVPPGGTPGQDAPWLLRALRASLQTFFGPLGINEQGAEALLRDGRLALPVSLAADTPARDRQPYLRELVERLADRPGLRLEVCPGAGERARALGGLLTRLGLDAERMDYCAGAGEPIGLVLLAP